MSISRRQFFRGLVGQNNDQTSRRQRTTAAVDAFVRTNLLPYDFALTGEQTEEALFAARNEVDLDSSDDALRWENRLKIREVVDALIERWRSEYLRAEEVRREAGSLVAEFLAQAPPEDLESLRRRFYIPYSAVLEEEVERQVRSWLGGLSNDRLAACDAPALRELVFSELRSWC
jgi:hypothetical protein